MPSSTSREAPRAVLFDLDGTLIDTKDLYLEAYRRALATPLGRLLSDIEILRSRPRSETRFLAGQVAHLDLAVEEVLDAFHAEYARLQPSLGGGVFPGVPALLSALRADGRPLGIVTGKSRRSWQATLARAELGPFDVLVLDDDVAAPKPDPEGLRRALEGLGVRPRGAIYVGDTRGDLDAAAAAGMPAAAALWSRPPEWRSDLIEAAHAAGAAVLEAPSDLLRVLD